MLTLSMFGLLILAFIVSLVCKAIIFTQRIKNDGFFSSLFGSSFIWGWRFSGETLVLDDPSLATDTSRRANLVRGVMKVWYGAVAATVLSIGVLYLMADGS